nr:MAG TPA: hypothetical protein [Crassvirales sp.]
MAGNQYILSSYAVILLSLKFYLPLPFHSFLG